MEIVVSKDEEKWDEYEQFLIMLLSDANLPTGGFVSSSGLEAYVQTGLLSQSANKSEGTIDFVRQSLLSYSQLAVPFLESAHRSVNSLCSKKISVGAAFEEIQRLDRMFDSMLINQVSRRASTAQGNALLALYSRSFFPAPDSSPDPSDIDSPWGKEQMVDLSELMSSLKLAGLRPDNPEGIFGHWPICFAVFTAALRLSLPRTSYLHIFLQARSIISAAVRMNIFGPYLAQRILLLHVRPMIKDALFLSKGRTCEGNSTFEPAMTWPLGEITSALHDSIHSRIFNS